MRIVIITAGVSRLLEPIVNEFNVVGLIRSGIKKKRSPFYKICRKLIFFILNVLKRNRKCLKAYAKKKKISFREFRNGNAETKKWIEAIEPDLIIVYSMSELIKEDIFSIPAFGTINYHTSYLPELKGPSPDVWYYYHKNLNPGATVHYIDSGEDTGDIICQERINIKLGLKSKNYYDLIEGKLGVKLLTEAIKLISSGNHSRITQPKNDGIRARRISIHEHDNLIDWNVWDIERVWHFLRGTEEWFNGLNKPRFPYLLQRWEIGKYKIENNTGIKNYQSGLMPEDKIAFVKELQQKGRTRKQYKKKRRSQKSNA